MNRPSATAIGNSLEEKLSAYVESHRGRLIEIVQRLVRIPSENMPPVGHEQDCQQFLAESLRRLGYSPTLYQLQDVPGLLAHPLYLAGRVYRDRPNIGVRKTGRGGGRSLLLSGHIDTVPRGTQPWSRDPFSGDVKPLAGAEGHLRRRVGDWRIFFELLPEQRLIVVKSVKRRGSKTY